ADVRARPHRDALAGQPDRRQGRRRGRHDRFDAGGRQRGRRRAGASRGQGRRDADHGREGLAHHPPRSTVIPAAFEYQAPTSVDEAVKLLDQLGDRAKVLAGGHSLIPIMKLRLAQPEVLVDIGRIGDLRQVRREDGRIAVGALVTHAEVMRNGALRDGCPLLAETAAEIGDIQVRNRGTLGGALAHADPAADYPAAILALDAEIVAQGPAGGRTIPAGEFFTGLLSTALAPNELLVEVRVPTYGSGTGGAYRKLPNKASHYAVVGVAALARLDGGRVASLALAITGA